MTALRKSSSPPPRTDTYLVQCSALLLLLTRSPRKPNEDVSSRLTEAQQASMKRAVELAQQYAANPSTEAIWLHLIGLVEQV